MIGEKKKEEKLFYYLRPEELIPEDHILRLIDRYVDFSFIRPKVEHLYSDTWPPFGRSRCNDANAVGGVSVWNHFRETTLR